MRKSPALKSGFLFVQGNAKRFMLTFQKGEHNESISALDRDFIEAQLGRPPRGLEAVAVRNASGQPAVIRVASLVDDKPFPTLFWLVDAHINYQLDQLEAAGEIARLQEQVDASSELQITLSANHRAYIKLRDQLMTAEIRQRLIDRGYWESLSNKGVGGIGDFTRIRCLHTWYAAHLVRSNAIGELLEEGDL